MPILTIWAIGGNSITISGGQQLSGFSQGDGSHLDNLTITLDASNWEQLTIDDRDAEFEDNQGNQRLEGAQSFDGVSYADNLRVEAEYTLTLEAPDGTQYTAIGVNINEPGQSPAYGTVEGLSFIDSGNGFPPIGQPLTVVDSFEGPRNTDTPYDDYFTPPCFVSGTLIRTIDGEVPVETLSEGSLVDTLDHGFQPLRLRTVTALSAQDLIERPAWTPVFIPRDAFPGRGPHRDLVVSPQHRILVTGAAAELWFGTPEVLVAARHLVDEGRSHKGHAADGVMYHHLLFDRHEIIYANGLATESYRPGPETLGAIDPETLLRVTARYPDLLLSGPPARPIAKRAEGRILRQSARLLHQPA